MKDYIKILFPYAYNILGSAEDAKDAVQDVLSGYLSSNKEGVENEKGYLIKSVINRSINIKNKKKKLSYGEQVWLPEPVATEEADTNIQLSDIVSYSLLVLLEQLNPRERAVFILKEGFGYSHEEIADVLSGTVENSRKLLSRAKSKLNQSRQPARLQEKTPPGFLEKYVAAIRERDVETLESLLSKDISFFADGGDKIRVVKKTCTGIHEVAVHLVYVYHKFQTSYSVTEAVINHQPALLYFEGTTLKSCQVLELSDSDSKIYRINTILDPEKLKGIRQDYRA